MRNIPLITCCLLQFFLGYAQQYPKCALDQSHSTRKVAEAWQVEADIAFDQTFRKWSSQDTGGVLTIPVVVHVIYLYTDENIGEGSNITVGQIESQIRILNEDYRREFGTPGYNEDPVGADTEIAFCLAQEDPRGQPTSGITRDTTDKAILRFPEDDEYIKSKSYWDPTKYLNMYVIPRLDNRALGYAQFPGKYLLSPHTDGVVIVHNFFGDEGTVDFPNNPYNTGRTTTHEVGHWLGLKHIWADELGCSVHDLPDSIDDTPTAFNANFGCNRDNQSCQSRDMVENYMDYSNDTCFNIFTQGQKSYMRWGLTSGVYPHRSSVWTTGEDCKREEPTSQTLLLIPGTDPASLVLAGLNPNEQFQIVVFSSTGRKMGTYSGTSGNNGTALLNVREISYGFVILRVEQETSPPQALKAVITF